MIFREKSIISENLIHCHLEILKNVSILRKAAEKYQSSLSRVAKNDQNDKHLLTIMGPITVGSWLELPRRRDLASAFEGFTV